jgi:hypothetical protein
MTLMVKHGKNQESPSLRSKTDNPLPTERDPKQLVKKTKAGKWTRRFMFAALIQGSIATLLAMMLAAFVISTPYPKYLISIILEDPSVGYMEISALAGLGLYFLIGVIGTGVTSYFYHYFEMHLNKNYNGLTNVFAWLHLLLMNIGIACTSVLMIYAGFIGDTAVFPKEYGGFGMAPLQVSQNILNQFIAPVGSMMLITAIGAICGGIGLVISFFRK